MICPSSQIIKSGPGSRKYFPGKKINKIIEKFYYVKKSVRYILIFILSMDDGLFFSIANILLLSSSGLSSMV